VSGSRLVKDALVAKHVNDYDGQGTALCCVIVVNLLILLYIALRKRIFRLKSCADDYNPNPRNPL